MSAGRRALLPTAEQERIIGHWLSRCGRAVSTNARPLLLNLMDHQAVCESPSQARLMEELALGERPLRQALTELEGLGFLAVTRYAGRPSRYQVNVETILARIEGPDREPEHSRGVSPGAESDANLLRSAGTSRPAASIPPPPARATRSEPPPAKRSRTADVPELPRGPAVRGSGRGHSGCGLDNPASLLPELSEVRWMKVLARESGVRLPNILAKDVQEWLRRGITLEDADYAFKAAARAGSVRFSFVEAVFDRLLLQRGPVRASQHTYREDMEPLSFENHRRRTQG